MLNNTKKFIITVDTEGEKGWTYHRGDVIQTACAKYLPRFQALCNKYGYKPVYLTNYEMICDDYFVRFAKEEQDMGHCEVGIHIHAWNNPPLYELSDYICDQSFLIEYPTETMRAKFKFTYDLISKKMGIAPVSHRAGRWVINKEYFKILEDNNILVDCSYTPKVDWSNTKGATHGGPNYTKVLDSAHWIGKILEVPVTIYDTGELLPISRRKYLKLRLCLKRIPHKVYWLRPALSSLEQMKMVLSTFYSRQDIDYVEFMIHSSELMPSGSPYFDTEDDINDLYNTMEQLFAFAKESGFVGYTLKEYYESKN